MIDFADSKAIQWFLKYVYLSIQYVLFLYHAIYIKYNIICYKSCMLSSIPLLSVLLLTTGISAVLPCFDSPWSLSLSRSVASPLPASKDPREQRGPRGLLNP